MIINDLFPTPVAVFKYEKLSEKNINFLKNQTTTPNQFNRTSEDTYILKQKCLSHLKDFVEKCLQQYFMQVYCPKNDVKLKITQSWVNYTNYGQAHHKHSHPCSFVSGCYYINASSETDKIYFYKSENNMLVFDSNEWNVYNSGSWWLPVQTGDLILFPSNLEHSVEPVVEKETRMSLSFNSFPVGKIGNKNKLTELYFTENDLI
jgi:uncharacterized protein (TIGR02466 family)